MRLCSNPSASPAFERVLQLAQGFQVSEPQNSSVTWATAVRSRRQTQRRLTPAEVLGLNEGYLDGLTIEDLATRFHVHRTTVMAQLERSRIPRRGKGPPHSVVQEAIQLYLDGQSTAVIGELLGFSARTIRQRLAVAGVQIRGPHDWQRPL